MDRELLQVRRDMGARCAGFVVDPSFPAPEAIHGVAVCRSASAIAKDLTVRFVIAVGNPAERARIAAEASARERRPGFGSIGGGVVGAGAVCTDSAPSKTTVVGVPARPIMRRENGFGKA